MSVKDENSFDAHVYPVLYRDGNVSTIFEKLPAFNRRIPGAALGNGTRHKRPAIASRRGVIREFEYA